MLQHKTAVTAPALAAAKQRHEANKAAHQAAVAEFNDVRYAVADHDNKAAAADRAAVDLGNKLAALVGTDAEEIERVPVRAAQADEVARAAFNRQQAQEKRALLPELERRVTSNHRAAMDGSGLRAAEFNDALAAYMEHLPVLEPLVSRLRNASTTAILDDMHQFSALPKIQGGQLFGARIDAVHYAKPTIEVA